jgi:AraC-like DNA-binding protein
MNPLPPNPGRQLSETHILGGRTRHWVVRVDESDPREWLRGAPVCPALASHRIAHVGIADAAAPYRVVRTHQSGTYFLACTAGSGRVLVDGRWQTCREGVACLLPPHALNAFEAQPGVTWHFCWVRYQQPPEQKPIATSGSPVLADFDGQPLSFAIRGLYHECLTQRTPAAQQEWVDLIQTYVMRFAQPRRMDDRLWQLWNKVAASLGESWTLERLAAEAHVSSEHLRRLCRRELGRSPVHQVIYLRMQHAAKLLTTTNDKIEAIAGAVGYENPFVFSTTFKKWVGWRPSDYRLSANACPTEQGKPLAGRESRRDKSAAAANMRP